MKTTGRWFLAASAAFAAACAAQSAAPRVAPATPASVSGTPGLMRQQALAAYAHKDYAACAERFAQAARLDKKEAFEDAYDAACCLALAGEQNAAFAALERATGAGLRDVDHLNRDPDLASLRGD